MSSPTEQRTAAELWAEVEATQKVLKQIVESVVINRFHHASILSAAFAVANASAACATQTMAEEIARMQRISAPNTSVGLN
jgi:hypothetical protein